MYFTAKLYRLVKDTPTFIGGVYSYRLWLDADNGRGYGAGLELIEEDFMRALFPLVLTVKAFVLAACTSTEWVNPNKPSSEYVNDYNKCQNMALRDPKLQQGSQLMVLNATERCLQKEGWRLVEQ